ncbi:MAG: PhzF family phenazine biosynthesis protein [Sphingobacteriales bacterium]|jgi:PhzF family phenazine biosynthesis protein
MEIPFFQVDAFAETAFSGNPAGVCLLEKWLDADVMQNIAQENNLAETAFLVKDKDAWEIRWFTPEVEVDLCGHATLASAFVLFNEVKISAKAIKFMSLKSGELNVSKKHDLLTLDFPTDKYNEAKLEDKYIKALGGTPQEIYRGKTDYLIILKSQEELENLRPDFATLKKCDGRGLIVSAKGKNVDFVSRFFGPQVGIDEDPVTGSAHTTLTPYWSDKLNKTTLSAIQLSKRQGHLTCTYKGDRVEISGRGKLFLRGQLFI